MDSGRQASDCGGSVCTWRGGEAGCGTARDQHRPVVHVATPANRECERGFCAGAVDGGSWGGVPSAPSDVTSRLNGLIEIEMRNGARVRIGHGADLKVL